MLNPKRGGNLVSKIVLEARRRFYPYVYFSREIVDLWNDAVRIKSNVSRATVEEAKEREAEFKDTIERISSEAKSTCDRLLRVIWLATAGIDPIDVGRALIDRYTPYRFFVSEDTPFETICVNTQAVLNDALEELEAKIVKRKLVALHKRWFYNSPRGPGHDISIEMIATVIIPFKERKEDYEAELERAMKAKILDQAGFESLEGELEQEVLGFEEVETDEEERDVVVESIKWQHKVAEKQLRIEDYLR